jgi:NitT/TauT family transport system permease protein
MSELRNAFLPNRVVRPSTSGMIGLAWAVAFFGLWAVAPFESLPKPLECLQALKVLWWQRGMGPELFSTLKLIGHATLITVLLSLGLAYASVIPVLKPLVSGIAKLRFLGLTGLVFPFTLVTGGGYSLKVWLLVFGMSTFFVTSMAQVVADIPRVRFEHMRVLGASDLRIVWEVVVRGTMDQALDIGRQNVAMGWSMITMVEGISRAEGGLGAMLLNQNKHFLLPEVYAILIVILLVGLLIDYGMGVLTNLLCPWARLDKVRG